MLAVVLVGWLAVLAAADTGGSMGGGDWGGGGGGGGGGYSGGGGGYSGGGGGYDSSSSDSSSSSWSFSSDSDSSPSRSYTGDGDSRSGGGSFPPGLMVILMFGAVGYVAVKGLLKDAASAPRDLTGHLGIANTELSAADVSMLQIALDGRARKFVQGELARIAKIADTATADGRMTMLREVGLLLRRARDAWVYGGAVNEPMRSLQGTKAAFDQHVADTRAKFRHETIRNTDGTVTTADAPTSIPRSHEGDGLILVSIIVAARSELFTVRHIADGEDLRKALEAASHRPDADLIAIEIVWQPSEDADRLSSIELEAKYPPPALIPIRGALVGKAFCTYCSGPYPAELVTCPHCGAPSAGRPTDPAARAA